MNASMVPLEAASKHSKGGMIRPLGEHLDAEPPAAHLVDDRCQPLGPTLEHVEHRRKRGGHSPLNFRLRDDVRGVDDGGGPGGRQRAACLHDESASFHGFTSMSRESRWSIHVTGRSIYPATSWW